MRFSSLVASCLFTASALSEPIQLYVDAPSVPAVDHLALTARNEASGASYVFLNSVADTYNFLNNTLATPTTNLFLGVENGTLAFSPNASVDQVSFQGTRLALNGSTDGFIACMNTNDPLGYSTTEYQLLYSHTNSSSCFPVSVVRSSLSNSTNTTTSSTAVPSFSLVIQLTSVGVYNSTSVGSTSSYGYTTMLNNYGSFNTSNTTLQTVAGNVSTTSVDYQGVCTGINDCFPSTTQATHSSGGAAVLGAPFGAVFGAAGFLMALM